MSGGIVQGGQFAQSAEMQVGGNDADTPSTALANIWYGDEAFTIGTAGDNILYKITHVEISVRTGGGGIEAIVGVFLTDADPPLDVNPQLIAVSEPHTTVAASLNKIPVKSNIIRGGTIIFGAVNVGATLNTNDDAKTSERSRFNETHSINPEVNRSITWTSDNIRKYIRVFYREYLSI